MPKVQKKLELSKWVNRAAEVMAGREFCPVARLCDEIDRRFPIPKSKKVLASMLMTDYEYTPDGKALTIRARLRMQGLGLLAQFTNAKMKATEAGAGGEDKNITVVIQNYEDPFAKKPEPVLEGTRELPPPEVGEATE